MKYVRMSGAVDFVFKVQEIDLDKSDELKPKAYKAFEKDLKKALKKAGFTEHFVLYTERE